MENSLYLLRSREQINNFKKRFTSSYSIRYKMVNDFLKRIPVNAWINYTTIVKPAEIPTLIGFLCCWIDDNNRIDDYVEFNSDCNQIRRKKNENKPNKPNRCRSCSNKRIKR